MGPDVRAAVCAKPARQATIAEQPMASRRDGRVDRRQPAVALAGGG
jgi:hypothetical protein